MSLIQHQPQWRLIWTIARMVIHRWAVTEGPLRPQPIDGGHQTAAIHASDERRARVTRTGGKPHPWRDRRLGVIEQFRDTVKPTVTPRGFTEAWRPEDHEVRSSEYAWLVATQDQELPPEWLTMRSNGLRADSIDALVHTDDDSYSMADLIPDDGSYIETWQMIRAEELLGGMRRIEEFLRQQDELQWHSSHPRRYILVVDGQSRRGIVPLSRAIKTATVQRDWEAVRQHMPPVEEVRAAMEHRAASLYSTEDDQGRTRWHYRDGTFASRDDVAERTRYRIHEQWDEERDVTDSDYDEEEDEGYQPNTPCPNEKCDERGDDCTVCFGDRYVLHTLGMDSEADWPPPGWLRTGRKRARVNRRTRAIYDALDAEISGLRTR